MRDALRPESGGQCGSPNDNTDGRDPADHDSRTDFDLIPGRDHFLRCTNFHHAFHDKLSRRASDFLRPVRADCLKDYRHSSCAHTNR